jgi:maltose O-acetyltransferase
MIPPAGSPETRNNLSITDGMAAEEPQDDTRAEVTTQLSWLDRAARAMANEFGNLNFRLMLASAAVRVLPDLCFCRLRTSIYRRLAGIQIGRHTLILGTMEFTETRNVQQRLRIGKHVIINKRFFADLTGDITIGDYVNLGHHIVFITADHDLGPAQRRVGAIRPRAITVENGCWIGARSTILPGVSIGESSVVTAGALVAASVLPNKMVGGVPARVIKTLPTGQ